jgi:hypothetical protein
MSMYKVIFVDSQNRITSAENMALRDPHPYMDNEARLQASTPDRANPERFGIDAQAPAEAIDGKWENCKVVDYMVVPMSQAEIDAREAERQSEEAQKEAARIAALVPIYGQKVGLLAQQLAVFEMAMPIEEDQAIMDIYAKWKTDETKGADAVLLLTVYNGLRASLNNADIYAIGKAIGVAV